MIETEESLLALLRRWKCDNPACGHEFKTAPPHDGYCPACPQCKSASRRTHEVMAVYGQATELSSYVVIPKSPTRGKLAAMALRYDHSIFTPKVELLGATFGGASPVQIAAVLTEMSKVHEEVAELGAYRPERETEFAKLLSDAIGRATEDAPIP